MLWMMLTPREAEAITTAALPAETENGRILALLKGRLKTRGLDSEIELSGRELIDVQLAAKRWREGGEKAFRAVLQAAERHR